MHRGINTKNVGKIQIIACNIPVHFYDDTRYYATSRADSITNISWPLPTEREANNKILT